MDRNTGFSVKDLHVEESDGKDVTLLEPFTYTTLEGEVITVPVGTTSDGASTPAILWPVLPPFGTYWMAAFLHDYLYRCSNFPRSKCDGIFREAMGRLGVGWFRRNVIWLGVRVGGWLPYNGYRKGRLGGV